MTNTTNEVLIYVLQSWATQPQQIESLRLPTLVTYTNILVVMENVIDVTLMPHFLIVLILPYISAVAAIILLGLNHLLDLHLLLDIDLAYVIVCSR